MTKRRGTFQSSSHPCEILCKKKRVPWVSPDEKKGSMKCTSPEDLLQSLLGETTLESFLSEHWEKKPLHVKRSDAKYYGSLFTLSVMQDVVKVNELGFLWDVNVSTYVSGQKKDFIDDNGYVTCDVINKLMDDNKATFKFDQPQRYIDEQWKVVERMESYFGALVGSHGFITPAGCRGSAPHCDDVENFILQTEGKQEWKVYKPMVELTRDFTQDMPEDIIGDPVFQSVLDEGDFLYIPRGYIYHSKAEDSSHSSHLAISTYQQNSIGDFMCHALQQAIENALEDDSSFRSGLPINYRSFLGTARNMNAYVTEAKDDEKKDQEEDQEEDQEGGGKKKKTTVPTNTFPSNLADAKVIAFKAKVQSCLSKLTDHIDVNKSADVMCMDFMWSRLPPYGHSHDCLYTKGRKATFLKKLGVIADTPSTEGFTTTTTSTTTTSSITSTEEVSTEKKNDEDPQPDSTTTTVGENEVKVGDETITFDLDDKIKIKYPDHIRVIYCNDDDEDYDSDDESETEDEGSALSEEEEEGEKKDKSKKDDKKKEEEEKVEVKVTKGDNPKSNDDDDDDDDDADITDTEPHIRVLHSLHNDRFSHMGFNMFDSSGSIKFDVTFAKALVHLIDSKDAVNVKDLLMDTDEEKIMLASKLNADGLLEVQSLK